MDSSEDDKCGDTTIVYNDGCDTDSDCDELSDDDPQQQNYTILKEEDILKLQEIDVTSVSTVLSVSKAWASILLRNFQWSLSRVYDEWFADGDRVRQTLGLFPENAAVVPPPNRLGVDVTCGICFEPYSRDVINSAACGHPYCKTCWEGYISTSINNDGPGCLTLRCPHPACGAAITKDMIDISAASDENKRKYSRYLLRSYVEDNTKNIKWCPAPGCDFAVVFETAVGKTRCHDITCLCSHSFCWNCMEEAHRPVDCATALEWNLKNSCESTNIEWILANAKPCPKCKRPIERYQNQGCIAMTCSNPCNYKFCWLCLDELSKHGWGAGSLYACKRYQIFGYEEEYEKAKKRRELAKNYIMERYVQYYERWAANESSRKKALA